MLKGLQIGMIVCLSQQDDDWIYGCYKCGDKRLLVFDRLQIFMKFLPNWLCEELCMVIQDCIMLDKRFVSLLELLLLFGQLINNLTQKVHTYLGVSQIIKGTKTNHKVIPKPLRQKYWIIQVNFLVHVDIVDNFDAFL